MFNKSNSLDKVDPKIWKQIVNENRRQEEHIELIASENYTSPAVMEAQGSQLTNKYAEGYIGKRFYGGCEFIDEVEQLAIDRLKKLYGAEYVNVQPHSGSQANQAVYFAVLKPGDTIMGMNLGHGGHLTHSSPANLSGKLFNIVPYGLNDKEEIDYDEMEKLATQTKPKLIIGGASAYALRFDWERMSQIAKKVGAYFMVDIAHYSGLVAGGVYPNPVPYADFVTSTTHKSLRGPRGGFIIAKPEFEKIINAFVFPAIQGGLFLLLHASKVSLYCRKNECVNYFLEFRFGYNETASRATKRLVCCRGYKICIRHWIWINPSSNQSRIMGNIYHKISTHFFSNLAHSFPIKT
jgi:glycine hydroxymethyltransferase